MKDFIDFMIFVYCFVDDWLKGKRLRQRGPQPTLSDSEVITIEVLGEFLGLETDTAIFRYFRRHYGEWFPALQRIHRTTFVRQAANLMPVKAQIWRELTHQLPFDALISIVDSAALPVCRLARAHRCRRFAGEADYGFDEMSKQVFYGFRLHLRVAWPGVIVGVELAPASAHDTQLVPELTAQAQGWLLGDRNYWSPSLQEALRRQNLVLLTPFKHRKGDARHPWPRWLTQKRRRIETVFSQLVQRFKMRAVWARDLWHLSSRLWRKILAHTFAVAFTWLQGLPPLQFAQAIAY